MAIKRNIGVAAFFLALAFRSLAAADQFELSWFTIDCGGGYSASGNFELEGTLGQHDAGPATGPMTGGAFELVGGFWPMSSACTCPGDTNGDGERNGLDIQTFVACALQAAGCACANIDGIPGVGENDVSQFVSILLEDISCP